MFDINKLKNDRISLSARLEKLKVELIKLNVKIDKTRIDIELGETKPELIHALLERKEEKEQLISETKVLVDSKLKAIEVFNLRVDDFTKEQRLLRLKEKTKSLKKTKTEMKDLINETILQIEHVIDEEGDIKGTLTSDYLKSNADVFKRKFRILLECFAGDNVNIRGYREMTRAIMDTRNF